MKRYGSILADEMGLGKTVSAIALILTLWQTNLEKGPVLVVCPATVIKQWEQEIELWTNGTTFDTKVYTLIKKCSADSSMLSKNEKRKIIKQVFQENAILVISYEAMRIDADILVTCEGANDQWFYIILDEAQKIKNKKSYVYNASIGLESKHKLILSGTPMQNSLQELWSLFSFIQPGLLGELDFFEKKFCEVILKGGYSNATRMEQELSKQCV
jgi:DNA excision repair protein ERCC-6